ncbi:hypothetical protein XENOCAPTIV_017686 [Xenoophorus captivus]|uniref:Uncharacterized protein n=1 Tax=Xenoophorus captivus TaxID=1517983 RepID=A0ABV0S2T9_9TELE
MATRMTPKTNKSSTEDLQVRSFGNHLDGRGLQSLSQLCIKNHHSSTADRTSRRRHSFGEPLSSSIVQSYNYKLYRNSSSSEVRRRSQLLWAWRLPNWTIMQWERGSGSDGPVF